MLVSIPGTAEEKNLVALPLPLKLCSSGRHDFLLLLPSPSDCDGARVFLDFDFWVR